VSSCLLFPAGRRTGPSRGLHGNLNSVARACNSVAHELAKFARSWDQGDLHVLVHPLPEFVQTLVARDLVKPMSLIERP
jgi:hypothetical protein